MTDKKLFPNIKRVLRNAISVGLIAGAANYQNLYPPTAETLYAVAVGFVIAFVIEFANAYKKQPKANGHRQNMNTFFLS